MPTPDVLQVWLGSKVRIPISTAVNGTPTNPSELSIDLWGAKGGFLRYVMADPEVELVAVGEWVAIVLPTVRGRWYYRWTSDLGASEGTFEVESWR